MIRHWCLALAAFLTAVGVQVAQGEMVLRLSATGADTPIIVADNQESDYVIIPGPGGLTTNWADTDLTPGVIAPFTMNTTVGVFTVAVYFPVLANGGMRGSIK